MAVTKKIILSLFVCLIISTTLVFASQNPIKSSKNGCFINTMNYREYILHEQPPQTIIRCFCVNGTHSGNCIYIKKPINADKLPYGAFI